MTPLAHTYRPYARRDRHSVMKLLAELDHKYPGGLTWLDKRLTDVELGHAYAELLIARSRVAAVSIVTPKGKRRAKLSTFFVRPAFRQHGLGTHLIKALERRWQDEDLEEVTVTIDREDSGTFDFFSNHHFSLIPGAIVPYGEGRWDQIMRWAPSGGTTITSIPEIDFRERDISGKQTVRVSSRSSQVRFSH